MKNPIKKLFVVLAMVMSFVAVQSVCAETFTVEGEIFIDSYDRPSTILVADPDVGDTEVSGVRLGHLCNKHDICLYDDDYVTVEYFVVECRDGTIENKACKITVDHTTVELRDCPVEE